eukprot:scaffold27255_cov104-Isochrysis_galbana.AAC.5
MQNVAAAHQGHRPQAQQEPKLQLAEGQRLEPKRQLAQPHAQIHGFFEARHQLVLLARGTQAALAQHLLQLNHLELFYLIHHSSLRAEIGTEAAALRARRVGPVRVQLQKRKLLAPCAGWEPQPQSHSGRGAGGEGRGRDVGARRLGRRVGAAACGVAGAAVPRCRGAAAPPRTHPLLIN